MSDRISVDAEALELRLPEDRKIQVRSPRELEKIAGILRKPIIREVVNGKLYLVGSNPTKKGSYLYAVYDGLWVYYCEVQAETPDREEAAK